MTWLINSIYTSVLFLLFASLTYLSLRLLFSQIFQDLDSISGLFIIGIACCTVLVLLECRGSKRIREAKRLKICNLCHCLKLLSKPLDPQFQKKIHKVAASYDLDKSHIPKRTLNLTINDTYELATLIENNCEQKELLAQATKWVLQCQNQGGFGLWPASSPRLHSTYQAVTILKNDALLDKCNIESHISWIKTLQQPDGSFRGPFSKRSTWQDTFYAIESLKGISKN